MRGHIKLEAGIIMRTGASVAVCACALALAASRASAADGAPVPAATPPIERANADRVKRVLDLKFAKDGQYLTAEQLRDVVGWRTFRDRREDVLEIIEIRAPHDIQGPPLRTSIPFGIAAIVWGVRHPTQAWRLFLPVVD